MLSKRKWFLRSAEAAALLGIAAAAAIAALARWSPESAFPFELAVIAVFAVMMFSFGTACALAGEFVHSIRQPRSYRDRTDGLSGQEIAAILHWAPTAYKIIAVAGIALAVVVAITVGSVEWSSGQPFTPQHASGAMLYLAAFFAFALPVLGSAARMSGAYSDNLAVLQNNAA